MSNLPDFSELGYQVLRELGHNYVGGRTTYLANETRTQSPVVIKQFQFAKFASDWSGFKAYEREIQVLRQLNHSGIPRYLDSFETPDGFCMVQEYKNAQSLAVQRSFEPDEIKQIAIDLLEILVYLQNRIPCVIHRDIKPENILVEEGNKEHSAVYLVDFGFARIGGGEVALSSVALGTLGFMPPEQLYNRQLTEATDLYSLGMTLIGLLTQTKSTEIDSLIDEDNQVNFKHLVPKLSLRWIDWLSKLVQSNPKNRYANAAEALEALKPIYVLRLPEVKLSLSGLEFSATHLGEKLTQTIAVSNSAPGTVLEGKWEVAPHESDPPHSPDYHAWISVKPSKFSGNAVNCQITVDTSQLMAQQSYTRQLLLHTNSHPQTQHLTLNVQTAPITTIQKMPTFSLVGLGGASAFMTGLAIAGVRTLSAEHGWFVIFTLVGAIVGAFGGMTIESATPKKDKTKAGLKVKTEVLLGSFMGSLILLGAFSGIAVGGSGFAKIGSLIWMAIGSAVPISGFALVRAVVSDMVSKGFSKKAVISTLILTVGLGMSAGLSGFLGVSNPLVLSAILGSGLPLSAMMGYPVFRRSRRIAKYRQSEQRLIKP